MEVDDDVLLVDDGVERLDEEEQRLLQVHVGVREPLADEHDHGAALLVVPERGTPTVPCISAENPLLSMEEETCHTF